MPQFPLVRRWLVSLLFSLSFSVAAEPPGLSVGGFLDAGGQFTDRGTNTTAGFFVNEGAVRLDGEWGIVTGLIDIPFTFNPNGNANLALGATLFKAQAYAEVKYDLGLFWRIGQFDRLWGLESNDSEDLRFTRHGILQTALPATHVGFLAGYSFQDTLIFDVMVANEDNAASLNNGNAVGNGNAPVLATRARFETENIIVRVGGQVQPNSGNPDLIADIVAQILLGPIWLGFESMFQEQGNGVGLGIQADIGYEFNSMIGAGVRFGYGNSFQANRGFIAGTSNAILEHRTDILNNIYALTIGPHLNVNDHLKFKVDYTLVSFTPLAGTQTTRHQGNVAAVLTF